MSDKQKECLHMQFAVKADVTRLSENEGGPITGYCADIQMHCNECGQKFEFIGVPNGYSPEGPMASADFKVLNVPIRPDTDRIAARLVYKVRPSKIDPNKLN